MNSEKDSEHDSTEAVGGDESIRGQVLDAILEIAPDLSQDDLEPKADLRSEIGLDSIDLLNIASAIGERTGFEIPEADLPRLHSVGDLIGYIENHCGTKA